MGEICCLILIEILVWGTFCQFCHLFSLLGQALNTTNELNATQTLTQKVCMHTTHAQDEIICIIKILYIYIYMLSKPTSSKPNHLIPSPTHLHRYEKPIEHMPFHVHFIYIKII